MNDNNCFIELRGTREALIDGVNTILEYSDEKIVILIKKLKIAITGKKLKLVTMNEDRISIEGIIDTVEYINNEKLSS